MNRPSHALAVEAVAFERYSLTLLREEAIASGKLLLVGNEIPRALSFADGYAPSGLAEIPGPCFVEVKLRITDRLRSFYSRIASELSDPVNVLLIVRDLNPKSQKLADEIVKEFSSFARTTIVGSEYVDSLAGRFPTAALFFKKADSSSALKALFSQKLFSTRGREQHLSALRSAYRDEKLVLFLGAGVSKSVDLPDWPELVRRVTEKVFTDYAEQPLSDQERETFHRFLQREMSGSPLIVARLLRNSLKNGFADAIRGALYRGLAVRPRSQLLDQVATLCTPGRSTVGLDSIVTYNYDDLVEQELMRRGVTHRSIYTEDEKASKEELPIYHVHGFLPREGHLAESHKQSLVLSEDAYHIQFSDPFVWQNITQLNLLRNKVCLFVGLSMTDPNLRRLMEIAASKDSRVRHYAVLRDHWMSDATVSSAQNTKALAAMFKTFEEASAENLGTSIMWIESYDELPSILEEIHA